MNAAVAPKAAVEAAPAPSASEAQSAYASQLAEVPEFADYGKIHKSSTRPVELTESEMEYVVTAVKHIFDEHIVFQVRLTPLSPSPVPPVTRTRADLAPRRLALRPQFNISNTIPDTVLEQVSVLMQAPEEAGLVEDFIIPIPSLSASAPGVVYVSFTREDPSSYAAGSFPCTVKFVSKEVDPSSGEPEEEGYPDEYQIEELELGAADYIVPSYATFSSEWERLKQGATATEVFALSSSESLKAACDSLIEGACPGNCNALQFSAPPLTFSPATLASQSSAWSRSAGPRCRSRHQYTR